MQPRPRGPRQATDAGQMTELFQQVRAWTMRIVEPLEIEDYVIQSAPFMSPPRWHIGHTSWFFELLLKDYVPAYEVYSDDYLFYFNSYYERFGTRIERDKRGTRSRPTVKDTLAYRSTIDDAVMTFLGGLDGAPQAAKILSLVRLGLEHEMQHQELLVYDIKHLLGDAYEARSGGDVPPRDHASGMAEVGGGLFSLGYAGEDFAFDNEKPGHLVYVNDFAIDRVPVSNGEYLEFIEDGGYEDYRWWYAEGWYSVATEHWHAPLYWERRKDRWMIRDFFGLHPVEDKSDEPVTHVSFYEASAFAKWAGKRLPTEAEWERAACFDPEKEEKRSFPWGEGRADASKANLFENQVWGAAPAGSYPEGRSAYGCYQMIGDVWNGPRRIMCPIPDSSRTSTSTTTSGSSGRRCYEAAHSQLRGITSARRTGTSFIRTRGG